MTIAMSVCHAAVHSIMLNSYDSYLPNTTLDQTSAFLSAVAPYNSLLLFGNSGSAGFSGTGGPSFPNGNYIYVRPSHTKTHQRARCVDLHCFYT